MNGGRPVSRYKGCGRVVSPTLLPHLQLKFNSSIVPFLILAPRVYLANALSYTSNTNWN